MLLIVAFEPWLVKPWLFWLILGKLMAFTSSHDSNYHRPTQEQPSPELKVHKDGEGIGSGAAGARCWGGQDGGQQD